MHLGTLFLFSHIRFAQKYFTNLCISFSILDAPVSRDENIFWAKQGFNPDEGRQE
jgi:hypothetical protein